MPRVIKYTTFRITFALFNPGLYFLVKYSYSGGYFWLFPVIAQIPIAERDYWDTLDHSTYLKTNMSTGKMIPAKGLQGDEVKNRCF